MNRFFTRFITILLFAMLPAILFAQDYTVRFNAGNMIPAANTATLSKQDALYQHSLFGNKYYLAIQFKTIPSATDRQQLQQNGIELIDYLPNYAYTAAMSSSFSMDKLKALPVRSVFRLNEQQKMEAGLYQGLFPPHAVKQPGYVDITVTTYEKMEIGAIAAALQNTGATLLANHPLFKTLKIRLPQAKVKQLAALPFVQWMEPIDPPNTTENLPGRTLHRTNILNDGVRNLKGDGINIGIWDGAPVDQHLDFSPNRLTIMQSGAVIQHATHCAGTLTGRGLINPRARGMAPNALLFSWDFDGDIPAEQADGIPGQNLAVSSHSYGSNGTPNCTIGSSLLAYSTTSRNTDINLNNFPNHLHVHSSGNAQNSCAGSGGYYTITGSGKSAKNNLVVGEISSTEVLANTSSVGPVHDGRIKPEISGLGTGVFSTSTPTNTYATLSGTSMATPGVAGTAVLLYQRYKQLNANAMPISSLIKNIICNGASDLGNPGPDYKFGFGRINALRAVRILENNRYQVNTVTNGAVKDVTVTVPAGASSIKVMLTWNDPAAAANTATALVNNLDLTVVNGATTTLPWIMDGAFPAAAATRAVDSYSNIEQVTIDNPPAGTYTLRVTGTTVATGPNQQYALTWIVDQPYIEVIHPNGNESFNPGSTEVITWDNSGVGAAQTVEYSLNNGGSWTTISSSVGPEITRLSWSVPAANTSTALIRVSSGALTDVSDANFRILNTPTGLAGSSPPCNPGEAILTWTAVANATHYDVLRLEPATGNFIVQAANVTGTTYTATGLAAGSTQWFSLVAKNNTTSSVSERSTAVSVVISNGGGGLGTIGAITGQSSICGTPSAVPYSVPAVSGATTYTWTAPPGALIAGGQGTPSITINYQAGSSSGNVSVVAGNGTCQTSPATLAVTIGSSSVPAPVSGGNQSAALCPGDPIPTFTATATVTAGNTLIWYSAATGGTVVSSPTLNTVGTVTYYAAARNNTTLCESNTRTPVTLTITQTAAATITAGGPLSICQGGSVTLTANNGGSYLWSTGATTQSITVSATGSYTVTITTGSCVNTSPATVVTVNTPPTATITAGGPLAFCEGGSVTLTASAGNSWLWSTGATTQSITVTNGGNYTVTVTSAGNCTATSSATAVTINPRPVVTLTASPYTKLLPGRTTTLTAGVTPAGTYNYLWLRNGILVPAITGSSLEVNTSTLGTYRVTASNAAGCTGTSNELTISDSVLAKLFFIMPNPNNGRFDVTYYSATPATFTLTITDSKGSLVLNEQHSITAPYQRMPVNLRRYGSGVYTVSVVDGTGKQLASGKVVIKH